MEKRTWKLVAKMSVISLSLIFLGLPVFVQAQSKPADCSLDADPKVVDKKNVYRVGSIPLNDKPPRIPLDAVLPNGSNNWTAAYNVQSMVYHLMATQNIQWARSIVDFGDKLLEGRDAQSIDDGRPYAWLDRSDNLTSPYVWVAYTGHNYAPLMQFARFIVENPSLGNCTYKNKTFHEHSMGYFREFNRALAIHNEEIRSDGQHNYFVFKNHVPTKTRSLDGFILPPNMNANMFLAILHSTSVEKLIGNRNLTANKTRMIEKYVRYINDLVLERRICAKGRDCLSWKYSVYMSRAEDVGHANVVAKFMLDAHADGYGIKEADLTALANTIDQLMSDDGSFNGNLLDGKTIKGVASSVYYLILLSKFSSSLKYKIDKIVSKSNNFTYSGPWVMANHSR